MVSSCWSGRGTSSAPSRIQFKDHDVGPGVIVWGLKEARTQSGSEEEPKCGLRNICRGLGPVQGQLGSVQGPYVPSHVSLGSEQAQDQPGSGKGPKCGLRSHFQVVNKWRIQLSSVQGHRCVLRSVVGVMHKGRTQPDAVRGTRSVPGIFFGSLYNRCVLGSVCQLLYPVQDSTWFTAGT